jgi:glycine betaine/proline transport system substrate-binding protein
MSLRTLKTLLFIFLITTCLYSYAAAKKELTIGTKPYAADVAVTYIWKQLLNEKGYHVKIRRASRSIVFVGVAKGSMNLTLVVWLPYVDKAAYDAVKNKTTLISAWYSKGWQGLAVPDYVHINSIEGLKKKANEFSYHGKKLIHTADPGAVVTQHAKKAIRLYHLPFKAQLSSETASLAGLESAYKNKRPYVLTLWYPHWAWAQYKLHMLKDPKHAFTKPNKIYSFAHKGFKKKFPQVTKWLENFHLSASQTSKMLNEFRKDKSPSEAASNWISKNKKIWHRWFQ